MKVQVTAASFEHRKNAKHQLPFSNGNSAQQGATTAFRRSTKPSSSSPTRSLLSGAHAAACAVDRGHANDTIQTTECMQQSSTDAFLTTATRPESTTQPDPSTDGGTQASVDQTPVQAISKLVKLFDGKNMIGLHNPRDVSTSRSTSRDMLQLGSSRGNSSSSFCPPQAQQAAASRLKPMAIMEKDLEVQISQPGNKHSIVGSNTKSLVAGGLNAHHPNSINANKSRGKLGALSAVVLGSGIDQGQAQEASRLLNEPRSDHISSQPAASRRTLNCDDDISTRSSIDSLANALVASSLASSRAAASLNAGKKFANGQVSRPSLFNNSEGIEQSHRTPSPAKGLRVTLRDPAKNTADITVKTGSHNSFGRKNISKKHTDFDRKRHKAQVTESERKRYEGLWAANRGLFTHSLDLEDCVLNIVVRDIWQRSLLPFKILAEVWELVNLHNGSLLYRDEFVVGLWLIDQSLKGNKLPVQVQDSIWASVRGLPGITARQPR